MALRHILSTEQFLDSNLLLRVFALTDRFAKAGRRGKLPKPLRNNILASVFYEPSTRTRFSFEAAMLKLGGQVLSMESALHCSSAMKGESLTDSIRVIGGYADAIVLRHPQEGSAAVAASVSPVPLINAGDGGNEHPSQSLIDAYTIKQELGTLKGLHVAFACDPLHSRTIRSLALLLSGFPGIRFTFISPPALRMAPFMLARLRSRGARCEQSGDLRVGVNADVLYMNRLQKERFAGVKEFQKYQKKFTLTAPMLKGKQVLVLDPLPRIDEIGTDVDALPGAAYFRQAKNGLYVRMALLDLLLAARR